MVGGLLVSQVLTLFITPVIYTYMEGLSGLLSRAFRRSTRDAGAATAQGAATVAAGD